MKLFSTTGLLFTLVFLGNGNVCADGQQPLAKDPRSTKVGTGYAKVEAKGQLLKLSDSDQSWVVFVHDTTGLKFYMLLTFPNELEDTVKRLKGKQVVALGDIILPFGPPPSVGGESFLAPPFGPTLFIRKLTAATNK
jgi:hypothetical protein